MDLKQIEYFVQVAEQGSFSRASVVLQVAQPALSRQIRALEVELHQPLFSRNGRGVTLTAAGQRLLGHGRGILQQVQRARQDLEDQRGAATGLISVGLPPSVSRTLTAPLVEAFRQQFPRATLSVVEGLSTYALEWLQQGRVDCAVVYNATPAPPIELVPVLQERLYLVSARSSASGKARGLLGKPVTLAQVAQHELVMPGRPHALRMRLESALAEQRLKPRVGLEIDSVPAMLDLVQRLPLHAVLPLNALRGNLGGSGHEDALLARPVAHVAGGAALDTSLWIATSAMRLRGPLLDQTCVLLAALLNKHLAGEHRA